MNRITYLVNKIDEVVITYNDKIKKLEALYVRSIYENKEEKSLIKEALKVY